MADLPYVIVPKEPTAEMNRRGHEQMPVQTETWFENGRLHTKMLGPHECVPPGNVYRAMLSASSCPVSLEEIVGVLEKADKAFAEVKAEFGAPGDYGYDSLEGKVLFAAYKHWADTRSLLHRLKAQMPGRETE